MKTWVVICIPNDTDNRHWFAYNRVSRKSIRCIDSREAHQLVKTLNERATMLRRR
jgi:hypothetical protein